MPISMWRRQHHHLKRTNNRTMQTKFTCANVWNTCVALEHFLISQKGCGMSGRCCKHLRINVAANAKTNFSLNEFVSNDSFDISIFGEIGISRIFSIRYEFRAPSSALSWNRTNWDYRELRSLTICAHNNRTELFQKTLFWGRLSDFSVHAHNLFLDKKK